MAKADDTAVLLVAHRAAPTGRPALTTSPGVAMVPLAGRPLLYWAVRELVRRGRRRFVWATGSRSGFLEELCRGVIGAGDLHVVPVPPEAPVEEAVAACRRILPDGAPVEVVGPARLERLARAALARAGAFDGDGLCAAGGAVPPRRWAHGPIVRERSFNTLAYDLEAGVVTKSSRRAATLIDESSYLLSLPPHLAVFFPRVLGASLDPERPWLRMEYYAYPSLSDLLLFADLDLEVWDGIVSRLFDIVVGRFMAERAAAPPGVLAAMYLGKTARRLAEVDGPPLLVSLLERPMVVVNGRRLAGVRALWGRIEAAVGALDERLTWSVIHGDLGFSNILCDPHSGICRFVDPRGRFGGIPGLHGDPRYDVAKLYHSLLGRYDAIINDLFQVVGSDDFRLDIHDSERQARIRRRFERAFFPVFDRREITLITGLLFLSMLPLHDESPQRQTAMYLRGLQLLDEIF